MNRTASDLLAQAYQQSRRELRSYLTRMVLRPDVAEELVQQAALKLLEAERGESTIPTDAEGVRAWLFRVATHLAIDHLRRHSTWREEVLLETREPIWWIAAVSAANSNPCAIISWIASRSEVIAAGSTEVIIDFQGCVFLVTRRALVCFRHAVSPLPLSSVCCS